MFKYFLYRYIRLDTNEVFYIGIGTKPKFFNSFKVEYGRALNKNARSEWFKKIIAKTKYRVEIVFESNCYETIKAKEIEFIALYGRKDKGLGSLCNLSDGGEGANGAIRSREAIQKTNEANSKSIFQYNLDGTFIKEWVSGSVAGKEINIQQSNISSCATGNLNATGMYRWSYEKVVKLEDDYINKSTPKKIYQYTLDGNFIKQWNSGLEAGKKLNINSGNISLCVNGKMKSYKKFRWSYDKKDRLEVKYVRGTTAKKVYQYSLTGNFIKEWKSISEASRILNIPRCNISYCAKGKLTQTGGYKWSYLEIKENIKF